MIKDIRRNKLVKRIYIEQDLKWLEVDGKEGEYVENSLKDISMNVVKYIIL